MAKVVLPSPRNGLAPAFLGGFNRNLVENLEWYICLSLQGSDSLEVWGSIALGCSDLVSANRFHGPELAHVWVRKDSNLRVE